MVNITIIGATGAVGEEMISIINERDINIDKIELLASKRSVGKKYIIKDKEYFVDEYKPENILEKSYVLLATSSELSKLIVPVAMDKNCFIIDNSSAFRNCSGIPLVIPEINSKLLNKYTKLIANPNCSTIIMAIVVNKLLKLANIKRIVVTTMQSASGAGKEAMNELKHQAHEYVANKKLTHKIFKQQYLWNVFPHNSEIDKGIGYNYEEIKMIKETNKIFGDKVKSISPTCTRVPTLRTHTEILNVTFEESKEIFIRQVIDILQTSDDIEFCDDYCDAIMASGKDKVYVSRIRSDPTQSNTFNIHICGDQLRKGAALNAVQIMEAFLRKN